MRRHCLAASGLGSLAVALSLAPGLARAASDTVAPPGDGQPALAVRATAAGVLAHVCKGGKGAACDADGGALLELPDEARPLFAKAKAEVIPLEGRRSLVRLDAPADTGTFTLLVAAPVDGSGQPVVLFKGFVGRDRGEHGEARRLAVMLEPRGQASRVLVGQQRDDVRICGRSALVLGREVSPTTMSLVPDVSAQSLPEAERKAAPKLAARKLEAGAAQKVAVARPLAASSAVKKQFATLADGDPKTTWSEAKTGPGRGEFVTFGVPSGAPVTEVELWLPPAPDKPERPGKAGKPAAPAGKPEAVPAGKPEPGAELAAPRVLYLATDAELFEVTLPKEAEGLAHQRYGVRLPKAVQTSCLAVVLEESKPKAERVGLAEVVVRTRLDTLDAPALGDKLALGGADADEALALLPRLGAAGYAAIGAAYGKLDGEGQRKATLVLDGAPCSDKAPFFALRLRELAPRPPKKGEVRRSETDPVLVHARDQLRRCGTSGVEELATIVEAGDAHARRLAASDLAIAAPGEAVRVLSAALAKVSDGERADLRSALSVAAKSPRARAALDELLEGARGEWQKLGETARVDVLRSLGPTLPAVKGAAKALAAELEKGSFRAQYLLAPAAAELARSGDAGALAVLVTLQKSSDAKLRARAAGVAGRVPKLAAGLVAALGDVEVRVREASAASLGLLAGEKVALPAEAVPELVKRLVDPWTIVRRAAVRTLGALPSEPAGDKALRESLADLHPDVRGLSLEALATRGVKAALPDVRSMASDGGELLAVRVRALAALATLCDRDSADYLVKTALRAKAPRDEADRTLGRAALLALAELRPAELDKRLAPLFEKGAAREAEGLGRAALEATGRCGK